MRVKEKERTRIMIDLHKYRLRNWVLEFSVTSGIFSPYKTIERQVRAFCERCNLKCECHTNGLLVKHTSFVISGYSNEFFLDNVRHSIEDYFRQF